MTMILVIASETFTLLRRDRIFVPTLLIGFFLIFLSSIISGFTIEDMSTVYFDFSLAAFNIAGSFVAILWGTKTIADAKIDGAIDVQLASPIDRSQWLVGKFLGMALTLCSFGTILALILILAMLFNQYGSPQMKHTWIFAGYIEGWVVLAAMSIFFSTFSTPAISMFSSLCAWGIGLTAEPVSRILNEETNQFSTQVVEVLVIMWNFQNFDLSSLLTSPMPDQELLQRFIYGLSLCISIVATASLIFRRRDVV